MNETERSKELKDDYVSLTIEKIIEGPIENVIHNSNSCWQKVNELDLSQEDSEVQLWAGMIAYRCAHLTMQSSLSKNQSNASDLKLAIDQFDFAEEQLKKVIQNDPILLMTLIYQYAVKFRLSLIHGESDSDRRKSLSSAIGKIKKVYFEYRGSGTEARSDMANKKKLPIIIRSSFFNLIELICYITGEAPIEEFHSASTEEEKKLLKGQFYILRSDKPKVFSGIAYDKETAISIAKSENPDGIVLYSLNDSKWVHPDSIKNSPFNSREDYPIELLTAALHPNEFYRLTNNDSFRQAIRRFNRDLRQKLGSDKVFIGSNSEFKPSPSFDKKVILVISKEKFEGFDFGTNLFRHF